MGDSTVKELNTTEGLNRFRFQTFREKVQAVNIDVAHKVLKSHDVLTDEEGSYFIEGINKWQELNCTGHFALFLRDVRPYALSLVQLLYHKNAVVKVMLKHLKEPGSLALEPLLDLVAALARDIQDEFYECFQDTLEVLIELANHVDLKVLEAVFSCMAYLFKYLGKQLLDDIILTFDRLCPLLGHGKEHIRRFAAEAFGPFLRKVPSASSESVHTHILEKVNTSTNENLVEAVGVVYFQAIQQVKGNIHSRAPQVLKWLLVLGIGGKAEAKTGGEKVIDSLVFQMCGHSTADKLQPMWEVLMAEISSELQKASAEPSVGRLWRLQKLFKIARMWLRFRRGVRVHDRQALFTLLEEAVPSLAQASESSTSFIDSITGVYVELIAALLVCSPSTEVYLRGKSLLDKVCVADGFVLPFLLLCESLRLQRWEHFPQLMLPSLIGYMQKHWSSNPNAFLLFMARFFEESFEEMLLRIPHSLKTKDNLLKIAGQSANSQGSSTMARNWLSTLVPWEALLAHDETEEMKLGTMGCVCSCVSRIALPFDLVYQALYTVIESYSQALSQSGVDRIVGQQRHSYLTLVGSALSALSKCATRSNDVGQFEDLSQIVRNVLISESHRNAVLLHGIAEYLACLRSHCKTHKGLASEHLEGVVALIGDNVGDLDAQVRRETLRIICSFQQHNLKPVKDTIFTGSCPVYNLCLDLEDIPDSVNTLRQKTVIFRKIDSLVRSHTIPVGYLPRLTRYLMALLSVPFTPLWTEAIKTLQVIAQVDLGAFWPVFKDYLLRSSNGTLGTTPEVNQGDDEHPEGDLAQALEAEEKIVGSEESAADVKDIPAARVVFGNVNKAIQERSTQAGAAGGSQIDANRFHSQLLRILGDLPHIVEQYSGDIVPLFFDLFQNLETVDVTAANVRAEIKEGRRSKVKDFLSIFAKVHRPERLQRSAALQQIYLELLCNGDDKLQQLSLDCLIAYKIAGMDFVAEHFKALCQDDTFRDRLSTLNIEDMRANVTSNNIQPLLDIVARILYGKLISRRGRTTAAGLKARRVAIFAFFTSADSSMLENLVNLMIQPFALINEQPDFDADGNFYLNESLDPHLSIKRQLGFLHVLEDAIKQLRTLLQPFLPKLVKAVLYVLHYAEQRLSTASTAMDKVVDDGASFETFLEKQSKEARMLSIRRLKEIFDLGLDFDFDAYLPTIFRLSITDRLPRFATENSQSPSSLMELFVTWSQNPRYAPYLVKEAPDLIPKVVAVISSKKVRPPVIAAVLTMTEGLLDLCDASMQEDGEAFFETLLRPYVDSILTNLNAVISISVETKKVVFIGNSIPARVIRILARLSEHVSDGEQAEQLLSMLLPYAKRPPKAVPESVKVEILRIFSNFVPMLPGLKGQSPVDTPYFSLVAHLFGTLETREARAELVSITKRLAQLDSSITVVADLAEALNAYSTTRLDEPDFDKRFGAFTTLNQELYQTLTATQWLPVLHNLLFYVQEREDFAIRTSASHSVTVFIRRASGSDLQDRQQKLPLDEFLNMIVHVLFPAIKRGMNHTSIAVRQEFINILGQLVVTFPDMSLVSDMTGLLADGDDEASFFGNILHLQIHRRMRAMKRLAQECLEGELGATSTANIFIPLVAHFIFESDRSQDHNLINEAIATIAACSRVLKWGQYWALLKRFLNALPRRPELEKALNRLIIQLLDAFHFSVADENDVPMEIDGEVTADVVVEPMDVDIPLDESTLPEDEADAADEAEELNAEDAPSAGVTSATKVRDVVLRKVLPTLQAYIEKDDNDSLPTRVPLAVAVASLLKRLSEKTRQAPLAKLITTLCNFLRLRGQEARDTTRDTLVKITCSLGPAYLPFVLKELEGALTRGYQLHVLGYTIHSILLEFVKIVQPGEIDICVEDLVRMCTADVFGEAGAEREVQELRGKMREIKTTKSFDSFELISKVVGFDKTIKMLTPLKGFMIETTNAQVMRKVDDILKRIALGINNNTAVRPDDLMIFVHDLLTENFPLSQPASAPAKERSVQEKNFMVNLKRPSTQAQETLKTFQANAFRFIHFGLSLLLNALKSERISLRNTQHLSMLDPLVPLLGRGLYSKHTSATVASLRIFTMIGNSPLPKLKESMPVVVRRLFDILTKKHATSEELTQATFRLLTTIIRDCKYVTISEQQLVAAASIVRPDLENQETDRQGTAFSLIRAILSRKIVVKEMYEVMDVVSKTMITSQSSQIRELCRHAYIQFLLDYPHGPGRLKKQITYLVKNLSYEHETGRQSVLAVFDSLTDKLSDDALNEFAELFFLSLVMCLVNDASSKCREHSGTLIKKLLTRLDSNRASKILQLVDTWFGQGQQLQMQRTAAQVAGLVLEAVGEREKKWIPTLNRQLESVLGAVVDRFEEAAYIDEEMEDDGDASWELAYYSLKTFSKVVSVSNAFKHSPTTTEIWKYVRALLLYPHQWVRAVCSRLLGMLFETINAETGAVVTTEMGKTVQRHFLLADTPTMVSLVNNVSAQLESAVLTADAAKQVVKNLFFIGKCMLHMDLQREANGEPILNGISEDAVEDDEDEPEEEVEEDGDDTPQKDKSKAPKSPLLSLCRRLSYLARTDAAKKRGPLLRQSVFQWFAAMIQYIPKDHIRTYLPPIMAALYHTSKDDTSRGAQADQLRLLASEVLELLQKHIGTEAYVTLYSATEQRVQRLRQERRAQRSIQAVLDPEARAKRRNQKNEIKKRGRKRKAEEFAKGKMKQTVAKRIKR